MGTLIGTISLKLRSKSGRKRWGFRGDAGLHQQGAVAHDEGAWGPSRPEELGSARAAPQPRRHRERVGGASDGLPAGHAEALPRDARLAAVAAEGQYGGITPPGTLGIVGGSLSALFGSSGLPNPFDKPVRQARLREQSRFRKDLGRVHEDIGIHDFLASSKRAKGRGEGRVSTATATARLSPPRRSTVTYDMKQPKRG